MDILLREREREQWINGSGRVNIPDAFTQMLALICCSDNNCGTSLCVLVLERERGGEIHSRNPPPLCVRMSVLCARAYLVRG